MRKTALCALIVGVCATVATAGPAPIFFATSGQTLYRINGGLVDSFIMSDDLTSLAVGPNGTIWGTSESPSVSGFREIYTIADPFGTPSLVLQGTFLSENTPTISFVGNDLYGIQRAPGSSETTGDLVLIDVFGATETLVGSTGRNLAGSGYDAASDTFYGIGGGVSDSLFTVDYSLINGPTPDATLVGSLGVPFVNTGGEFYNGVMYAWIGSPLSSGDLILGTIDTTDGSFTELLNLGAAPGVGGLAMGLAVVPEPASLLLLAVGGLMIARRRN